MSILAVGDEPESFSSFFTGNTQTSLKYPGQRGGVSGTTTGSVIWTLVLSSAVSECWVHALMNPSTSTSTTTPLISFYNSGTSKDALRILQTATSTADDANMSVRYNNTGTTYTEIATFYFTSNATGAEIDIYFKRGASGVLKIFINGRLVVSETGNYSTVDTTWDTIRFGANSATAVEYGGVIVADEPTLNMVLDHLSPNASGTYSDWTGSYTDLADVTGAPAVNAATYIDSNTAAQKFSANYDTMDALATSREIKAVQLSARGIIESGSSITSVSFTSRHSSTDYTHNNLGLGTSDASARQVFALDPAGGAWSESDVNAIEFGVLTA